MNRQSTEEFEGSENTLYVIIVMDVYHYTFVQIHRMYNTKWTLRESMDYEWLRYVTVGSSLVKDTIMLSDGLLEVVSWFTDALYVRVCVCTLLYIYLLYIINHIPILYINVIYFYFLFVWDSLYFYDFKLSNLLFCNI